MKSCSSARMARPAMAYAIPPSSVAAAANSAISSADMRSPSLLRRSRTDNKQIPRAAHGADVFGLPARRQLGAQAAHVTFDHAGARIEVYVPDMLEQHAARDD